MGTKCTLFRFIQENSTYFYEERHQLATVISRRLEGKRLKRLLAHEKYCRWFRDYAREEDPFEISQMDYSNEQLAASLLEEVLDDVTVFRAGSATSKRSKRQGCCPHTATHRKIPDLRPLSSFPSKRQKSRFLDNKCNRDQLSRAWWWYI